MRKRIIAAIKRFIINTILEDISNNGPLRSAVQGERQQITVHVKANDQVLDVARKDLRGGLLPDSMLKRVRW